jgi:alkylmercury lyase
MADFLDGAAEFLATFTKPERAVSRHAFLRLLEGRGAALSEVGGALGLSAEAVAAAVRGLRERGTLLVDDETGTIVGARGLTLRPTRHALAMSGRRFYAFCAIDAIGIPAALGADARVASGCHGCGAPVALTLRVQAPAGTVIWASERDPARSLREHT